MQYHFSRFMVLISLFAFAVGMFHAPLILAYTQNLEKVDVEIQVQVNQKGFLDKRGKVFGPRNPLIIPKNKIVRITFVFEEKMTNLAYGDTHQVAITSKKGWTKETEKIWMFHQASSITFQSGEEGERYRGYCILDCIGMDALNNLVIKVV